MSYLYSPSMIRKILHLTAPHWLKFGKFDVITDANFQVTDPNTISSSFPQLTWRTALNRHGGTRPFAWLPTCLTTRF